MAPAASAFPLLVGLFLFVVLVSGTRGKWDKVNRQSVHSLVHHSIDVAAVFARMMQLPIIRDRLEDVAIGIPLDPVKS